MSNFNFKEKRCLLTFVIIIFLAGSFTLSYAQSFTEIKEKIEEKVNAFGRVILKFAHPTSTHENTEITGFHPYGDTQTGYDANQEPYEYNLKVVFRVNYKGWVKHHTMEVAVYFKYLMPKDIQLESDTSNFKTFGLIVARKMIANLKSEFD